MPIRSVIAGCGSYLPKKSLSNKDLESVVETTDEWIVQRTGIRQRHVADKDEKTSDMAIAAALRALGMAGLKGSDLDLIVLATTTPDQVFPATAMTVQDALGMSPAGMAFDIQAVCSGFIYALAVADNFIRLGQARRALVIGAEKFTSLLDWTDRTTCVLFGDGAGAVVLEADDKAAGTVADRGILSTHLHSDGSQRGILFTDGGPGTTGTVGHVRMNGKEVFRHAVQRMSEVVSESLEKNGLTASDIDWLVPHQANKRIIDSTAQKLALPSNRVILTVDRHGNTSAASIPLALDEAVRDGRIKRGNMLLLEAMGAGLTWGAALVRW